MKKVLQLLLVMVIVPLICNGISASELSKVYGYVGVAPVFQIFTPFGETTLDFYDENNTLVLTEMQPAGATREYTSADMGIFGLCFIKIKGSRFFSCIVVERFSGYERGCTEPQTRFYKGYSIGRAVESSSGDDYIRLYTPRRMTIRIYDQNLQEIQTIEMEKGEVRELNVAYDLNLDTPYGIVLRGSRTFAISFLEAPSYTWLMIPQGWHGRRHHFPNPGSDHDK